MILNGFDTNKMVAGEPPFRTNHEDEVAQLQTQIEQLEIEIEHLTSDAMFQQQMIEPDDIIFARIERAARASFRRHQANAHGQQTTRADSYESHLVWAAQADLTHIAKKEMK